MIVKVECPCGARFAFEVEPVNGRMPVGLNCPTCGNNATDLANAVIAQQLGQAPPPVSGVPSASATPVSIPPAAPAPAIPRAVSSEPIRIGVTPAAPAPPAPAAGSGLRISKTHAAPAATPTPQPAAEAVVPVAAAPAPSARPQPMTGEERRRMIAESTRKKQAADDRPYLLARNITLTVGGVFAVIAAFWIWYSWFAREPKVVYSLAIPVPNKLIEHNYKPPGYFDLIAPGQLLTVKSKQVALFDITKQETLWTTQLQSGSDATKDKKADATADDADTAADEYGFFDPKVVVTSNDLWMAFSDRLLRLDRATGNIKETTVRGRISDFSSDDSAILLVHETKSDKILTRISLADGAIQNASLTPKTNSIGTNAPTKGNISIAKVPAATVPAGQPVGRHHHERSNDKTIAAGSAIARTVQTPVPVAAADAAEMAAGDDSSAAPDENDFLFGDYEAMHSYLLAGQSAIQCTRKILEKKITTHEAMKAKKGPSVLDSGNVTASQGLDLAQEMINDSTRSATGGVTQEDTSRYQVTLHRWFAGDATDWTGEVIGPPSVYPLKTVDVLEAGRGLIVFDKQSKKLWEGKVAYASQGYINKPAFLENGNALYVADPGGLTRFDLASGNKVWRVDSVGIKAIRADARGNVYLATTDAGADHISHPQEFNVHDKIHPLLVKIDAKSGKILWSDVSVGDDCFFSGKFLYSTLTATLQSPMKLETGPDVHYNFRMLDPGNGRLIWEREKINDPHIKTQAQSNWVLLQFEDGVTVMKFWSL